MKKEGHWLMAIVTLVIGIVLIFFHGRLNLVTWIVEAIGVLIVVPAVWLILQNTFGPRDTRNGIVLFAAIVALALGIWICCEPDYFATFIVYIFAGVLIVAGIWHMMTLSATGREIHVPVILYLLPVLLIVTGLAFIFTGLKVMTATVILVMGIALICSTANTVFEGLHRWTHRPRRHPQEITSSPKPSESETNEQS